MKSQSSMTPLIFGHTTRMLEGEDCTLQHPPS